MGALIYFNEMLPAADSSARRSKAPKPERQVEVFTWSDRLWLRVGLLNRHETEGFAVELTREQAEVFTAGLDSGMSYLWGGILKPLA